jgi:hypothetical protein
MAQRKSRRQQGMAPEKSQPKTKKPKKTRKKKKTYLEKINEKVADENVVMEVTEDEEAKQEYVPEGNVPSAKKHKKKDKEKNKKDNQVFYARHFFEKLRKGTMFRIRNGYRIRYTTLKKYKLVKEYEAWTKYAIKKSKGDDKKIYEEHLQLMKDEIIFERRMENKVAPYVNETITQISNALNANNIGTSIDPKNITILINPEGVPEEVLDDLQMNTNTSKKNIVAKKLKTKKQRQKDRQFQQAKSVVVEDKSKIDMTYWGRKTYTINDVKARFDSNTAPNNLYGEWRKTKGEDKWTPLASNTGKNNYKSIVKLLDILACMKGDYRKIKTIPGRTSAVLIDKRNGKEIKLSSGGKEYYKNDRNPADKRLFKGKKPMPDGSEDILECFSGTPTQISQKLELIVNTPSRYSFKKDKSFNKHVIGAVQALAREKNSSEKWRSPFKWLLGEEQLLAWTDAFDAVMNRDRAKRAKDKEEGKLIALPWKKCVDALVSVRKKFIQSMRKDPKSLETAKKNLDYVLFACYVLSPVKRDDYGDVYIVDKFSDRLSKEYKAVVSTSTKYPIITRGSPLERDPEIQKNDYLNYYSTSEEAFCFQKYKTRNKYFQRRLFLKDIVKPFGYGKILANIIKESLDLVPRNWLFGRCEKSVKTGKILVTPMVRKKVNFQFINVVETDKALSTKGALSKNIIRIQKANGITENPTTGRSLGVNLLRHSFIVFQITAQKINAEQRLFLANNMLHTEAQQKDYVWDLPTQYMKDNAYQNLLTRNGKLKKV